MLSKSVPAMPRTEAADGSAVIVGVDEPTEQIKRGALFSGRIDTAQQVSNVPRVHDAAFGQQEVPRVAGSRDLLHYVSCGISYSCRQSMGGFSECSVELASVHNAQHTPADDCRNRPAAFDRAPRGLARIVGQPVRQRHLLHECGPAAASIKISIKQIKKEELLPPLVFQMKLRGLGNEMRH